jgi:hypothetical protein
MNVKLLLVFSLLFSQLGFSQTEKLLKGVVSSENFLLYNVDVINKTSKQVSTTNENGEFAIFVKVNDSLIVYGKGYVIQRLKVKPDLMESKDFRITMESNPEELESVLITKTNKIKLNMNTWREQSKRDEITAEKNPYTENKNLMVRRGQTYVNGLNFWGIGKKIVELLSKKEEPEKEIIVEIKFETLAKKSCDEKFFTQSLKLKPEEIDLFLKFCDVDPNSKKVSEQNNILSMMDFLTMKNKEFQEIK